MCDDVALVGGVHAQRHLPTATGEEVVVMLAPPPNQLSPAVNTSDRFALDVVKFIACLILFVCLAVPARGATDVWLMYGWGPDGWSSGIDQIARKVRTLRGVDTVHVSDYRNTQDAYNYLVARPAEHSVALVGYSCGGNAALSVASSLHRATHVIMLQPSIWCGRYHTTASMRYVQDTWSAQTFGLGSYQPEPLPAHYTTFIERHNPHGAADTNVQYQRDAVFAVGAVADTSRRWLLERHLRRSAPHVDRRDAQAIWVRE